MKLRPLIAICALGLLGSACTPTVQVAMPNEPININLNAKIEHQISIKVDKDLENLFDDHDELF